MEVAHSQHSDFNYEQGVEQLKQDKNNSDPCAARKDAAPGSPVWCLCDDEGQKIRWEKGDEPSIQAVLQNATAWKDLEKGAKGKTKQKRRSQLQRLSDHDIAEINHSHSNCITPNNKASVRFQKCRWVGDANGNCCSKKGGCANKLTSEFNRD